MTEKHYSSDWAKSKSRTVVSELIERTVIKIRRPKDVRVLCFPGIDAQEIFEVYDALGIPRSNITGLERDKDIAEEIERKKLGIRLLPQSLEEYVEKTGTTDYHIISLDFTGPMTPDLMMRTLRRLVDLQRPNSFVIHTANLLKRDAQSNDLYLSCYMAEQEFHSSEGATSMHLEDIMFQSMQRVYEKARDLEVKMNAGEKFTEEKKASYPFALRLALQSDKVTRLVQVLKFLAGEDYEDLLRDLERDFKMATGIDITFNPDNLFDNKEGINLGSVFHQYLENVCLLIMRDHCQSLGIHERHLQNHLLFALFDASRTRECYRPKFARSYTYISESGSPMIGIAYLAVNEKKLSYAAREIADFVGFPGESRPMTDYEILILKSKIIKYMKERYEMIGANEIAQVHDAETNIPFLGNSSKPVLTKRRFIEEYRELTPESEEDREVFYGLIKDKYRGWQNKPLPQWLAHCSMGTYDQVDLDAIAENGLELITREEAIELLQAGIPPKDVYDAYPTSFRLPQLRAMAAHVTMGTYNKD